MFFGYKQFWKNSYLRIFNVEQLSNGRQSAISQNSGDDTARTNILRVFNRNACSPDSALRVYTYISVTLRDSFLAFISSSSNNA
jgi:ribosomal protein S12